MSTDRDHDEFADARGAYLLGALPEDERERFEAHLATCAECRAETDALRVAVEALPAAAPQVDPPPELKGRIMAVVESEAELLRASGPAADRPPTPSRRRAAGFPALLRRPLVAGAAAATLLALGVAAGVLVSGGDSGSSARTVQARVSPGVSPGARASLVSDDGRAALVVSGMPKPPPRRVYELWIRRGDAPPRPAGATFDMSSGRVEIPGRLRGGDRVLVTEEPAGGSAMPTRPPIVAAELT